MTTDPLASQRLLSERDAANVLGLSPRTLQDYRLDGNGPPFVRVSPRTIRYSAADLSDWLAERTFTSTSEYETRPAA